MKQVLQQDEAKRDWLLAALVSHHPNLVDYMTTKDNLTFSQLKVRLHSLSSNVDNCAGTALVVNHGNHHGNHHEKKRKFDRSNHSSNSANPASTSAQSCTWCKARNFRHEGRVWQECRKLKASKTGSKAQEITPSSSAHIPNSSAHVAELTTLISATLLPFLNGSLIQVKCSYDERNRPIWTTHPV